MSSVPFYGSSTKIASESNDPTPMNRLQRSAVVAWSSVFMVCFISAYFLGGRLYPSLDIDHSWQAILEYVVTHS